jgi:hypothetical protein
MQRIQEKDRGSSPKERIDKEVNTKKSLPFFFLCRLLLLIRLKSAGVAYITVSGGV